MQSSMSDIFLAIFSLALFLWAGKYLFMMWHFGKMKEQVNKLEARLAVLRMLLKSKLKGKGAKIQEQFRSEGTFLEKITPRLNLLTTFNFNRNSDYEEVISLLLGISKMIDAQTETKMPGFFLHHERKMLEQKGELLKKSGAGLQTPNLTVANEKSKSPADQEKAKKVQSAAEDAAISVAKVPGFDKWSQLFKYDKGNLFIIKEIVETTEKLIEKVEFYNLEQPDKLKLLRAPDLIIIENFASLKSIIDAEQEKAAKNGKKSKGKSKDGSEVIDTEDAA